MKSLPHVFLVPVFQSKRSGIGFLLFSSQDPISKETQLETYQPENKQLTQHLEGPSVPGMGGSQGGLCPCVPTVQGPCCPWSWLLGVCPLLVPFLGLLPPQASALTPLGTGMEPQIQPCPHLTPNQPLIQPCLHLTPNQPLPCRAGISLTGPLPAASTAQKCPLPAPSTLSSLSG